MQIHSASISIKSATLVRLLSIVAILLILISTVGQVVAHIHEFSEYSLNVRRLIMIFELGSEQNIPTHYSALLLLISAILLSIIFFIEYKKNSWSRFYWIILSAGFLFMTADETYQIHEKLIEPVRFFIPKASESFILHGLFPTSHLLSSWLCSLLNFC